MDTSGRGGPGEEAGGIPIEPGSDEEPRAAQREASHEAQREAPRAAAPGCFRLRLPVPSTGEARASYFLGAGPGGVLVDPGGAADAEALYAVLKALGRTAGLAAVVLTDPRPETAAGLLRLEAEGFRGQVYLRGEWLGAARAYGFASEIRPLGAGPERVELASGRSLRFFASAVPAPHGSLLCLDETTGTLLSGERFSPSGESGAQGAQGEPFLLARLAELARRGELARIAPSRAPVLAEAVADFIERFASAEALLAGACADPDAAEARADELAEVERSISSDPLTRLKNQRFLHSLLLDRLKAQGGRLEAALLFVSLDGLVEINRELGREGGDEALKSLGYILGNDAAAFPGTLAFKLNSPAFVVLVPGGERAAAAAAAERIRKTVRESEVSSRSFTVSIGLVYPDEATGSGDAAIRRLEEIGGVRGLLAKERGGDTVCDSSTEHDAELQLSKRIVLVEPETAHAAFLAARLEGRGFRVAVFPEGRSALERILADGCDLVVSEAMVPRLSGFQLREALMADSARSRIPFVLVSHRKDDEYLEKAASLRITHYLKKPYALAEILGLAENLARG